MPFTFSHSKLYRHLTGFLLSLYYVFFSIFPVAAQISSVNAQTAAQLLYMQYGTASGFSVTAAGTAVAINLTPGGNQLINDAVGGAAVMIGAAGTQVISTTAAGFNSLWQQAVRNKCAANPSASVCASAIKTYSIMTGGLVGGTSSVPPNCADDGSTYYGSLTTSAPSIAWQNTPGTCLRDIINTATGAIIGGGVSVVRSSYTLTNTGPGTPPPTPDALNAANTLSPAAIAAAASVSPSISLPGADVPSVLVSAPPGTLVYTPNGVVPVPASGSLSVPNPNYNPAKTSQAIAAGQAAYDAAKAAGSSDTDAEAKRSAAISAYADAKAAGSSDTEAAAAAKAAAKATAKGDKVSLADEELPAINLPDTCPDCTNKLGDENFFTHAKDVLSNKFPFDVIGDSTQFSSLSSTCPSVTFWGKAQEICAVRTVVVAIKYPVGFSWLIYLITHL